jgi:UDP-perosamine 4-acetyltransferase
LIEATLLIGAGGHAKVVAAALIQCNVKILGFVDPQFHAGDTWYADLVCLGNDDQITAFPPSEVLLVNGLGSLPGQHPRRVIYRKYRELGYRFKTVIHPSAGVAEDVQLGDGVQIMAGALVQTGTRIGDNTIINTGAIVDHDCQVEDNVHIATGAALSGGVRIGSGVHVGTGASVIQGVTIGENAVIGAGAVVTRHVAAEHIVYPARSTIKQLPQGIYR